MMRREFRTQNSQLVCFWNAGGNTRCVCVCVWWSWFSTSRRYVSFLHCFCSKVVVSTKWMFQDNGAFIVLALFVIRIRRRGRSSWMLLPVIWEACASLGSKSELFSVSFLLGSGFCLQTDNRKAVRVCTCAHVCVCAWACKMWTVAGIPTSRDTAFTCHEWAAVLVSICNIFDGDMTSQATWFRV